MIAEPENIGGDIAMISDALVRARRDAAALPEFPGPLPETLEAAYAVQQRSIQAWDDDVSGWKVGGVPAAFLNRFSDKRLVGPIFGRNTFHAQNGELTEVPVFPGFAAVEGEFVFCLGETEAEDRLHIGIEVASSPLHAINDIGPVAVICDFGNNNGLIVGPEIADWRGLEPEMFTVTTRIGGHYIGSKLITDFPGDAIEALGFLRRHAEQHGIALPPGTFVSSGAITGVHEAKAGAQSTVDFGPFGRLHLSFVEAEAAC